MPFFWGNIFHRMCNQFTLLKDYSSHWTFWQDLNQNFHLFKTLIATPLTNGLFGFASFPLQSPNQASIICVSRIDLSAALPL